MRYFLILAGFILLLTQCSKRTDTEMLNYDGHYSNSSNCAGQTANCVPTNFTILITDSKTGQNYVASQNVIASDIQLRTLSNQQTGSSNISVASPTVQLKNAIIFPVPSGTGFLLTVKNLPAIEVTYSSRTVLNGCCINYTISGLHVKNHQFTSSPGNGGYILDIRI